MHHLPIDALPRVAWLASEASASRTGVDLPMDGGAVASTWIAGFNTL